MANWTPESQPFGPNRAPLLAGLASDGSNVSIPVAVDPATGRLLVNSTGGSSASSVSINDGVTTSLKATVAALTNSNPLAVEIVDGSGNQITSFGGGTQYAEGTTTAPATGTAALGRYLSSPPGTLTNGQMSMPLMDVFGQLKTVVTTSSATGSPVPGTAFYVAGQNSGNLKGLSLDSSGQLLFTGGTIASGDGQAWTFPNSVANFPYVYNGSTWDRIYEPIADAVGPTGLISSGLMAFNGSTWNRVVSGFNSGDGNGITTGLSTNDQLLTWNGSSYDRVRSANAATGTTGTGLLGSGMLGYDGTNWQQLGTANGDGQSAGKTLETALGLFNGSNIDRARPANTVTGTTGTGLLGTGPLGIYNSVAPTISNGNYAQLQLDVNGNLKTTSTSGTQYAQGTVNALPTGTVAMGINPANVLNALNQDDLGNLRVSSSGSFSVDNATVAGDPIATSAPGVQVVTLAGPLGDPLSTTGNSLNVTATVQNALTTALTVQPGNTQNTTPWLVTIPAAHASGIAGYNTGASGITGITNVTGATNVSIWSYHFYNPNNTIAYLQIFNILAAGVNLGTTVANFELAVPANGWVDTALVQPWFCQSGISIAATTTWGGNTSVTTGVVGTITIG